MCIRDRLASLRNYLLPRAGLTTQCRRARQTMTGNSPQALQQPTHGKSHLLVVISLSVSADERAQALAQQLGVPHITAAQQAPDKASQGFDFELHVDEDRTLVQPRAYKSGPIGIDFNSGRNLHRLLHSGGRNQTLARAVGIKRSLSLIHI